MSEEKSKSIDALELFERLDFDPLEEAIRLIRGGMVDDADKLNACIKLVPFRYRKAGEDDPGGRQPINIYNVLDQIADESCEFDADPGGTH